MATNFRVFVHRNSENVHLRLTGDFDGTSAYELLDVMERNSFRASRIFIHTESLKKIEPFGKDLFRDRLNALDPGSLQLLFTGSHASQLALEEGQVCLP
jgi:hypothetical protein